MRFATNIMAALVVMPVVLTQTPANALPCDNTRWCAQYSGGRGGGATNCGFFTLEQCRATVSGGASFCVPNQFYNPHGPAKRTRNQQERREVRVYAMPYDPYPWCAFYSDPGN